jgi:hypothetical protein
MREKVHTAICMVLVLVVFTGCKGAGTAFKVAFAVGYVALRAAAASAASHHESSEPSEPEPEPVATCEPGFVLRDGGCVWGSSQFSRAAAAQSVNAAFDSAKACRVADGPIGTSHARITFDVNGVVIGVALEPPYAGTPVGACVEKKLRDATVPPFEGDPVTVGRDFTLD